MSSAGAGAGAAAGADDVLALAFGFAGAAGRVTRGFAETDAAGFAGSDAVVGADACGAPAFGRADGLTVATTGAGIGATRGREGATGRLPGSSGDGPWRESSAEERATEDCQWPFVG